MPMMPDSVSHFLFLQKRQKRHPDFGMALSLRALEKQWSTTLIVDTRKGERRSDNQRIH